MASRRVCYTVSMTQPAALQGKAAPDFSLPDQEGKMHSLADYRGQWVVLYFYPKDDTPGCTRQACAIRDSLPDFAKISAAVLGVSVDSVLSHKKFAEKYHLPFTLLADENKTVVNQYGAMNMLGKAQRTSFLVNPDGVVVKVYESVNPDAHAAMILADLAVLGK